TVGAGPPSLARVSGGLAVRPPPSDPDRRARAAAGRPRRRGAAPFARWRPSGCLAAVPSGGARTRTRCRVLGGGRAGVFAAAYPGERDGRQRGRVPRLLPRRVVARAAGAGDPLCD